MALVIRIIGAILAAVASIFVLLIAVELYSSIVHPFPADFDGSQEQMCQHVARYPQWVLATVVPMWAVTAYSGTWIAARIGNLGSAIVIALLLLAAVILNVSMLPYPYWFKIAQPGAILVALAICLIRALKMKGPEQARSQS